MTHITIERSKLKQVLEALQTEQDIYRVNDEDGAPEHILEAITACEQALEAQPEQEPVAWMRPSEEGYDSAFRDHSTVVVCTGNSWTGWIPLYTTPPAAQRTWVGLTDVNAVELWQLARHDIVEFTRAIEAKLKEKNHD